MWRAIVAVVVSLSLSSVLWAQNAADGKKPAEAATRSPAEKKLLENPNDATALSAYLNEVMMAVARTMQSDPKTARQKLDEMESFVAELKIDQPAAQARLTGMKTIFQSYRSRLDVQNVAMAELEKALLENPDDAKSVSNFVTKLQIEVSTIVNTQTDAAEKKLQAAKDVLTKAAEKATTDAAKRQITTLTNANLTVLENSIANARMSLADLGKKLTDAPDSMPALSAFYSRFMAEFSKLRANPAEVAKVVEEATSVFQKVEAAAKNANVKSMVATYKRSIDSMARSLEAGKKQAEMIGKDAAPLNVDTWVNGTPLTDADLKGKVVFLDFWAVWCGPCIATFPHLREWNEKYADKGLVMIGLTNYYQFKWDTDAKKAARSTEKVTPAEEQEMLEHFAESYDLKHRFAIESNRSLSQYYGVTGIPHVVVIDREGKIRLMKVGSGEANAKEIGDLLAELLK